MANKGDAWTTTEIDLIVADYFEMRSIWLRNQSQNKLARYRALDKLIGRGVKSIERKHQNISAVLEALGEPFVKGLLPSRNYQAALVEGVKRYMDAKRIGDSYPDLDEPLVQPALGITLTAPPAPGDTPWEKSESVQKLVRHFDPAARDERNRQLGKIGEEHVFEFEKRRLKDAGRTKLSNDVRWVARDDGDGAGYDIHSFDDMGNDRLLEVKTTRGGERTPFYLSENERAFSETRPEAFRIFRLHSISTEPSAFEILPPLDQALRLSPTNYRAAV